MVVEASGLAAMDTKKGYSDPYVKLSLSKQLYKTTVKRKILNPSFNELFYFEPDGGRLVLEVFDNIKQKFMGQAIINDPSLLEPELVVEEYMELKVRPGKKNDRAQGRLKVRLYYSTSPESRPTTSIDQHFSYDEFAPHFQTGDLVAYSEYGLLGACQKVVTNTKLSRVGIVLRLANKWTQKEEPFVLEVTRNIDGFLDAYRETASNGASLFRFFERVHQIHAHSVWWIPLKKLLDERAKARMVEHIWTVHAQLTGDGLAQMAQASYPAILEFVATRFGVGIKMLSDLTEVFTPAVIAQALTQAGISIDVRAADITVADILKHPAYQDPILLRCLTANAPSSPAPQRDQQGASMGPLMISGPGMMPGMMMPGMMLPGSPGVPMMMGSPMMGPPPGHMMSGPHDSMMMMMQHPPGGPTPRPPGY